MYTMDDLVVSATKKQKKSEPLVSVVLPINNALPWLGVAVRDVLKQDLGGEGLELVCSWDGGSDADWRWLMDLAECLPGSIVEEVDPPPGPLKAAAAEDKAAPLAFTPPLEEKTKGFDNFSVSPREAANACRLEHSLKVVRYRDRANRGQGAAMSLALRRACESSEFVAQMEADDARPRSDAFQKALFALNKNNWDAVCTESFCFGDVFVSQRMMAYCDWQNSLESPEDLRRDRFLEIPALHQTALFRKSVVTHLLGDEFRYRDGVSASTEEGDDLDTPVDLWWWLSFFEAGFKCGRVRGERRLHADLLGKKSFLTEPPASAFFGWRQHQRQRTRTQGRLSIDNLRRVKIHFLLRAFRPTSIILVSVGATLEGWTHDLRQKSAIPVTPVTWRPSKRDPPPMPYFPPAIQPRETNQLRIFAYGDANVRKRILHHVSDWRPDWDLFVA